MDIYRELCGKVRPAIEYQRLQGRLTQEAWILIVSIVAGIMLLLAALTGCSSASGGNGPSVPLFEFYCRHDAILSAIAIEPYCEEEPVIVVGYVEELGLMHSEAECPGLGYIRIVGTRVVGAYPEPAWPMVNERVYSVPEYLRYFFGWAVKEGENE